MQLNKIPVIVITGFLGSGKTTLLNRLLAETLKSAVIINEFGSTPIDQDLLQQNGMPLTILAGGCLCCQIKDTLAPTLKNLWMAWNSASEKPFDRIIIETSGVASPEPILDTLLRERWLAKHYQLQKVITTVAVPSALEQLARFSEVNAQIAWADLLLLTHIDNANQQQIDQVEQQLTALAPATPQIKHWHFNQLAKLKPPNIRVLSTQTELPNHGFHSVSIYLQNPPSWPQLQTLLQDFVTRYSKQLLRIKGVIYPNDYSPALALHATTNTLYPPTALTTPTSTEQHSKLVFIGSEDLDSLKAEFLEQLALLTHS
jgi:G3E family GTPase